jgi:hypothetical protein
MLNVKITLKTQSVCILYKQDGYKHLNIFKLLTIAIIVALLYYKKEKFRPPQERI